MLVVCCREDSLISRVWRGPAKRALGKEVAIVSVQLRLVWNHVALTWQKLLVGLFTGVRVHIWGEERMNSEFVSS